MLASLGPLGLLGSSAILRMPMDLREGGRIGGSELPFPSSMTCWDNRRCMQRFPRCKPAWISLGRTAPPGSFLQAPGFCLSILPVSMCSGSRQRLTRCGVYHGRNMHSCRKSWRRVGDRQCAVYPASAPFSYIAVKEPGSGKVWAFRMPALRFSVKLVHSF